MPVTVGPGAAWFSIQALVSWEGLMEEGGKKAQHPALPRLDLCRIRPCAVGCSPGRLAGDSRIGRIGTDGQEQDRSKPATCMELLLAQGLHLTPSTPAL